MGIRNYSSCLVFYHKFFYFSPPIRASRIRPGAGHPAEPMPPGSSATQGWRSGFFPRGELDVWVLPDRPQGALKRDRWFPFRVPQNIGNFRRHLFFGSPGHPPSRVPPTPLGWFLAGPIGLWSLQVLFGIVSLYSGPLDHIVALFSFSGGSLNS